MKRAYAAVLDGLERILQSDVENEDKLQVCCEFLRDRVPGCDWVGFYRLDPEDEGYLVLGPFVGEPTEHTRIPVGIGVCGQAAGRSETVVVDDVTEEENYLACSAAVRSEIVVPIFSGDRVVAELDIDSHQAATFTAEERELLEAVAERVAELF